MSVVSTSVSDAAARESASGGPTVTPVPSTDFAGRREGLCVSACAVVGDVATNCVVPVR